MSESLRNTKARGIITGFLNAAGVEVDGNRPWDIIVHDPRFYRRVLKEGGLGAGESYAEGWWDCEALDELAAKVLSTDILSTVERSLKLRLAVAVTRFFNRQRGKRGRAVAQVHYDLGNELFSAMLGSTMNYSCAYWRSATNLDRAQEDKMDLICRKLQLERDDHLLDVGCGWGALARHAAVKYGCKVTGITISGEQRDFAIEFCKNLPVQILLMDYRDIGVKEFHNINKIASIGMFEHVGAKNYRTFIANLHNLLPQHGLFLLHTIGRTVDMPTDLWVDRYIFPNSYVPTMMDIAAMSHGKMIMEDWQNFGADYERTLLSWYENFERWGDNIFKMSNNMAYRIWRYYLLTYAGCFKVRTRLQLWQIVFSKSGVVGGYRSVR
jgi:cyclopropane-fatty-acyl-phospholipid synthase